MLNVVMLIVIMLSVLAPRTGLRLPAIYPLKHQLRESFLITVIMLSAVMLNVVMLSVVMLSVIMLSVMALRTGVRLLAIYP